MSHSSKISHPSSDLDSDVLIKVNSVSKKFCRDFKKSLWYGLKDTASDIFPPSKGSIVSRIEDQSSLPPLRPGEFWANQDISFEVKRGECLGLIGHNGAGKTTLLKMLNGLIKPDTGIIEMRGRIGALIALGAGFNPILTGRENIYINGSILGLSKDEIDDKMYNIIEFAEIEDAIDAPVRTYSSGMQVRLGFAVATALDPTILIVDEVLAVGDQKFRTKCANRIDELKEKCSIILVSHNMEHILRICERVMVLDDGKERYCGEVKGGVAVYNKLNAISDQGFEISCYHPIVKAEIPERNFFLRATENSIEFIIRLDLDLQIDVHWRLIIRSSNDLVVAEFDSRNKGQHSQLDVGANICRIKLDAINLVQDEYSVSVVIIDHTGRTYMQGQRAFILDINNSYTGIVAYQLQGCVSVN